MNYRHAFHAGNYADVFKHALLLQLLRALQRKEKGFLYLDTHAGRGAYELLSTSAAVPSGKNRRPEWPEGIGRLWHAGNLPPVLGDYVALVRDFDRRMGAAGGQPRFYPGSPWIATLVRRPQDRLVFWEQQPGEAGVLREEFGRRRRTSVECGDGYGALRAALPPPEHRALVLIDPPFEDPGEVDAILAALREGLRRFPGGIYAVWHPVTERAQTETFRAALKALTRQPTVWAELAVTADPQVRMKGCSLLVINPPWGFADHLQSLLPVLAKMLAVDAGATSRWAWLVPEQ
jgi:23S rRNA (adenine2030-N6)-methyltransferase